MINGIVNLFLKITPKIKTKFQPLKLKKEVAKCIGSFVESELSLSYMEAASGVFSEEPPPLLPCPHLPKPCHINQMH